MGTHQVTVSYLQCEREEARRKSLSLEMFDIGGKRGRCVHMCQSQWVPSLPLKEGTIYGTQNKTYAVLGLISGCLVMRFSHQPRAAPNVQSSY